MTLVAPRGNRTQRWRGGGAEENPPRSSVPHSDQPYRRVLWPRNHYIVEIAMKKAAKLRRFTKNTKYVAWMSVGLDQDGSELADFAGIKDEKVVNSNDPM